MYRNKIFIIILSIAMFILNLHLYNNIYSMGGNSNMIKNEEKVDIVNKFNLEKTDKIIIETNKHFLERVYIKKTIDNREDIRRFLSSLRNNLNLNDFVKALVHYVITFYRGNKEIFMLGVNDWEDGGFIRVGHGDFQSDLFPEESFYEVFHELIQGGGTDRGRS